MTITNFLQLQPSIRPVPAQVTSKYFTAKRATKTLHPMSPCTPVSVPVKITWTGGGLFGPDHQIIDSNSNTAHPSIPKFGDFTF